MQSGCRLPACPRNIQLTIALALVLALAFPVGIGNNLGSDRLASLTGRAVWVGQRGYRGMGNGAVDVEARLLPNTKTKAPRIYIYCETLRAM